MTLPKTTCWPSSQGVGAVVKKNWEPLVLGPAFAIERAPGPPCLSLKFSSANFSPQMDFPPVPLWLVKSPPWHMNPGITLWKLDPLKPNPWTPVQSSLKFWAVLGTIPSQRPITIRPSLVPSAVMSKKTLDLRSVSVIILNIIQIDFNSNINQHIFLQETYLIILSQLQICQMEQQSRILESSENFFINLIITSQY